MKIGLLQRGPLGREEAFKQSLWSDRQLGLASLSESWEVGQRIEPGVTEGGFWVTVSYERKDTQNGSRYGRGSVVGVHPECKGIVLG